MAIPDIIKSLANKVRNEIYGRDVRESIAKSMEVTGETAEEAKQRSIEQLDRVDRLIRENPQPSEVVDARGNHPILRDRLNSVDAQLAERATKKELSGQLDLKRDKTVKIEPEDLSERSLGLVTGDGTISLESIPQDDSVSPEKFDPSVRNDLFLPLTNRVTNGNFINGVELWGGLGGTARLSAANNILTVEGTGTSANVTAYRGLTVENVIGKQVYISAVIKPLDACGKIAIQVRGPSGGINAIELNNPTPLYKYRLSGKIEISGLSGSPIRVAVAHSHSSAQDANGKKIEVENVMLFDLTNEFGHGNEPTKEYLDEFFDFETYYMTGEAKNLFNGRKLINFTEKIKKQLETISSVPEKIWNNESVEKTVAINTQGKNTLILHIEKTRDTTFKIEKNTVEAFATNLHNSVNTKRIATRGYWQVDVSDVDTIKISNSISSSGAISTVEYWFDNLPRVPYQTQPISPKSFQKAELIRTVPGISVQDYRNGVIYASVISENTLKTSEDEGLTFIDKYTFTDAVRRVRALDNGNVLVHLENGELLVSTDGMQTFNLVIDFSPQKIHSGFGFTVYKNIVLIAPYATIASGSPGKDIYMSTDYGVTFKKIFSLLNFSEKQQSNAHIHSAAYDPYEDMIWVCSGDGANAQMIFYSKDMGNTWFLATKIGYLENQSTAIIPLRNCVLFTSDARLTGVLRYIRPVGGTIEGSKLYFDYPLTIAERWGKNQNTEVPIATEPVIDYENSIAYFSWMVYAAAFDGRIGDKLSHGEIYTTDGFDIKLAYKDDNEYLQNIHGIYGDFKNGKIAAKVVQPGYNMKLLDISSVWTK